MGDSSAQTSQLKIEKMNINELFNKTSGLKKISPV